MNSEITDSGQAVAAAALFHSRVVWESGEPLSSQHSCDCLSTSEPVAWPILKLEVITSSMCI